MLWKHLIVAVAAALASFSIALPAPTSYVLHEKRDRPAHGYTRLERVGGSSIIPLRIGLSQSNLDKGYDHLMDVSDPHSSNYGRHWTSKEIIATFAPSENTLEAVRNWLIASKIDADRILHTANRDWIGLDVTIQEAEELFQTTYYEHEHGETGVIRLGCDEYHLPQHIQEHIDYITPGIKLSGPLRKSLTKRGNRGRFGGGYRPGPHPMPPSWNPYPKSPWQPQLPAELQDCARNITPPCLRALYKIPFQPAAVPGNSFGIYESGDAYSQADLDMYFATYAANVPQGTHPVLNSIDGGQAPVAQASPYDGGESDVDFDIAFSLTYPQTVTLYQVDDSNYNIYGNDSLPGFDNIFLDAIDGSYCTYSAYGETGNDPALDPIYPDPYPGGYKGPLMCGAYAATKVISISYGEAEYDLPAYYQKRECNEFMKLGLQGVSFLTSSGDSGVATSPGDASPSGCLGPKSNIFAPAFLSTCPYVTSVGATALYAGQTILNAESVANVNLRDFLYSSGGGFSNVFPRPSYQDRAVQGYFATAVPNYAYYNGPPAGDLNTSTTNGIYNRLGRGYPDVSANGAFMPAFVGGLYSHEFGTSLSSPIFASIITLINGQRIKAGKSSVGFLNPTLYAHPEVLNDIVNGTNAGCGTNGFPAARGWDPSSGLGTPNYEKMLALFMSLP